MEPPPVRDRIWVVQLWLSLCLHPPSLGAGRTSMRAGLRTIAACALPARITAVKAVRAQRNPAQRSLLGLSSRARAVAGPSAFMVPSALTPPFERAVNKPRSPPGCPPLTRHSGPVSSLAFSAARLPGFLERFARAARTLWAVGP